MGTLVVRGVAPDATDWCAVSVRLHTENGEPESAGHKGCPAPGNCTCACHAPGVPETGAYHATLNPDEAPGPEFNAPQARGRNGWIVPYGVDVWRQGSGPVWVEAYSRQTATGGNSPLILALSEDESMELALGIMGARKDGAALVAAIREVISYTKTKEARDAEEQAGTKRFQEMLDSGEAKVWYKGDDIGFHPDDASEGEGSESVQVGEVEETTKVGEVTVVPGVQMPPTRFVGQRPGP